MNHIQCHVTRIKTRYHEKKTTHTEPKHFLSQIAFLFGDQTNFWSPAMQRIKESTTCEHWLANLIKPSIMHSLPCLFFLLFRSRSKRNRSEKIQVELLRTLDFWWTSFTFRSVEEASELEAHLPLGSSRQTPFSDHHDWPLDPDETAR